MLNEIFLENESATEALGIDFAKKTPLGSVIYLQGDLGSGKTTFVRGFLKGKGYTGTVKSPTYTLVEEYHFEENSGEILDIYHFDLYRLFNPLELENIGIREYFTQNSIVLLEWSENGRGHIPNPNWRIVLKAEGKGRKAIIEKIPPAP